MPRFGRSYIGRQDISPSPGAFELDAGTWPFYWTPTLRMRYRQTAGYEIIHPELGNGTQFTPLVARVTNADGTFTYPVQGELAYGYAKWTYNLTEAYDDGAVITQDWALAGALRSTGLFIELQL